MAGSNEFFTPTRRQREEEFLEQRLQQMESALQRLTARTLAIVDPITGAVVAPGGEGTGGGDEGGGDGAIGSHSLLDDAYHVDTETGAPVAQDLVVANTSNKWARFAVGAEGHILKVVSAVVTWVDFAASSSAALQAWRRNQIQNSGTSKATMKGLDDITTGVTFDKAGTIVGLSLDLDAAIGATSADWYELEVYVRIAGVWTATGILVRLLGDSTDDYKTVSGSYAFTANQKITVYDQRNNLGANTTGAKATIRVVFN